MQHGLSCIQVLSSGSRDFPLSHYKRLNLSVAYQIWFRISQRLQAGERSCTDYIMGSWGSSGDRSEVKL